jgi:ERCC4-type nuclease
MAGGGVLITVDANAAEAELHARLSEKFPDSVQRARLDVGDVRLEHPEHGLLIVERKSWPDLASSVTGLRYNEQKARQLALVAENPKATVIWLVVGSLPPWFAQWPAGSPVAGPAGHIEAAVVLTCVADGIPVLRAADSEAAVEVLALLARKLEEGGLDGAARAQRKTAAGYAGFAVKKSANVDGATTWQAMLASVRGLSAGKAKLIAERYPTAAALVAALAASSSAATATKTLSSIQVRRGGFAPSGPQWGLALAALER